MFFDDCFHLLFFGRSQQNGILFKAAAVIIYYPDQDQQGIILILYLNTFIQVSRHGFIVHENLHIKKRKYNPDDLKVFYARRNSSSLVLYEKLIFTVLLFHQIKCMIVIKTQFLIVQF